jgi:hypothetical protein
MRHVTLAIGVLACALPQCGGSSPTPPAIPTTTVPPITAPPSPTQLSDLSASITSPQSEASINCSDNVLARITLVNNGGTDVAVRGILMRNGITSGDCFGDHDFTYTPRTPVAPARRNTVVLDRGLYTNGAGCCDGKGCGGSCRIQDGFEVITNVGNVPAGVVNYRLFFQSCRSCAAAAATLSGDSPRGCRSTP